jgi:hypothetical protein
MSIAVEIRQVANTIGVDRPDAAKRLLNIAVRVERLELLADEIAADAQQAEQLRLRYSTPMSPKSEVIEFRRWRRP